ncbi:MAG: transferase hexapeptide repeat containing protein [Puniceicoccaceae bacterium 5H]|nr:MAG: transferase hexapeptide repeat containing protein [Puniceicoccaceae bacterium 5H]
MSGYKTHESAVVDDGARIGNGTRVWHFTHVNAGAEIGENCSLGQNVMIAPNVKIGNRVKIQNNVSVYEGTEIEDDVFLGPSCVLTNISNPRSQVSRRHLYEQTKIERGATIGANATIVCGTTLGRYCLIGAGAVVTKDVPPYTLMLGVPARPAGFVSRHGHPLRDAQNGIWTCPESGLRYTINDEGELYCLDLSDEDPLPETLATGQEAYSHYNP